MPHPASNPQPLPGPDSTGIILVDHGSRRDESNRLVAAAAQALRRRAKWTIVEPAHMELAEPSIATAFSRCVEQGATLVVVFPYLLSPGRHWNEDIPRLVAEAASQFKGVRRLVTRPFGLHPLLMDVIDQRIEESLGTDDSTNDARP